MINTDFLVIIKNSWELIKTTWLLWAFIFSVLLVNIVFNDLLSDFFHRIKQQEYFSRKRKPTHNAYKLGDLLREYGWRVEFEKWDGYKHIDIAITEAKVNIEVDGVQHNINKKQALSDLKRDYYSFKKGYVTLRIPNVLLRDDSTLKETAEFINKFLKESDNQLDSANNHPQ